MKFWKRLRVYLIGVFMGLILSYFIFGTRGCNWTPSPRLKRDILHNNLYSYDSLACQIKCSNRDTAEIRDYINKADIDFSKSKTNQEPKIYHLSHNGEVMKIALRDSTNLMLSWNLNNEDCNCPHPDQEVPVLKKLSRY